MSLTYHTSKQAKFELIKSFHIPDLHWGPFTYMDLSCKAQTIKCLYSHVSFIINGATAIKAVLSY